MAHLLSKKKVSGLAQHAPRGFREHAAEPGLRAWLHAPRPSDHVWTVLKAGESVIQTLFFKKTVVLVYRGAQPRFPALFWRQNTV